VHADVGKHLDQLLHGRAVSLTAVDRICAAGHVRDQTQPDGTVVPPTGKAFDLEFGQTSKWEGEQLIVISAFWDAALMANQIGLSQ
jgi:hypothetical protein